MKKIFISLLSVFVFSLIFSNVSFAQVNVVNVSSSGASIASVAINNVQILSQNGRDFSISFDISNKVGAQPQIKYSILLMSTSSASQTIFDQKVYDESLSLNTNSSINKTIQYSIPASLPAGAYRIILEGQNQNGLILAIAFVGDVKVAGTTENTVQIVPDSCGIASGNSTTTYTINCKVLSSITGSTVFSPQFVTRANDISSNIFSNTGSTTKSITIKKGTNNITLIAPKGIKPQNYNLDISLVSSDGKILSNTVSLHYFIDGLNGTIQNVVFDKTYYKAGDTAHLQIFSTESATSTITATIYSSDGLNCSTPTSKEISNYSNISLPILITKDCMNPKADLVLSSGTTTLDTKTLQITSDAKEIAQANSASKTANNNIVVLIVALILVLIIVVWMSKKKKGATTLIMIMLISSVFLGGAVKKAEAVVTIANNLNGGGGKWENLSGQISLWDSGWNDRVSSLYVMGTCARACSDYRFTGSCGTFGPSNDYYNLDYNDHGLTYGIGDDTMSSIAPEPCPSAPLDINFMAASCTNYTANIHWRATTNSFTMGYLYDVFDNDSIQPTHTVAWGQQIGTSVSVETVPGHSYSYWLYSTYNQNRAPYFGGHTDSHLTGTFYCPDTRPSITSFAIVPDPIPTSTTTRAIPYKQPAYIYWSSINSNGCSLAIQGASSSPYSVSPNSSASDPFPVPNVQSPITASLTCYGANNTQTAPNIQTAQVGPFITAFTADDTSVLKTNPVTTIRWSSIIADSCELSYSGLHLQVATSGSQSSGSLSSNPSEFDMTCRNNNSGLSFHRMLNIGINTPTPPTPVIYHKPSEIIWNDPNTTDTCNVMVTKSGETQSSLWRSGISGDIVSDTILDGDTYTLICTDANGQQLPPVITVAGPQTTASVCTPSKNYIGEPVTWTMENNKGSVSDVTWTWTDKGTPISKTTSGSILSNIYYSQVGTTSMMATGTVMIDGQPVTSTCSTTTIMGQDPGTNTEI